MRRNILVYKAPPNYEGYDLIAIHPDPRVAGPKLRLQVKSRLRTDAGYFFPMKGRALGSFDFLVFVRLNVGYGYSRRRKAGGLQAPVFYTIPADVVRRCFKPSPGWGGRVAFHKDFDLTRFKDELGFERIAKALGIKSPARHRRPPPGSGGRSLSA